MTIKSGELDNQERGLDLSNRSNRKSGKKNGPETLLAALRSTAPVDSSPHCGTCFKRGWNAAIAKLEELYKGKS